MLFSHTADWLKTVANGGHVVNANGWDILFFSQDYITQLDHEIEKYDGDTGELVVWVRIPTLDYDDDTVINMCYGNCCYTETTEDITGVWDSNYKCVMHLEESDAVMLDSTSNNNDGVSGGGTTTIDVGGGMGGTFFDTTDQDHIYFDELNTANATGTLRKLTVDIGLVGDGDLRVIIASKSGANFTVRSVHNLTIVRTGVQVHAVNLAVSTGDYIGFWCSDGPGVELNRAWDAGSPYFYDSTPVEPYPTLVIGTSDGTGKKRIRILAEYDPLTPTASLIGNGIQFDETDDLVVIPDFDYGDTFTVSMWVKIISNTGSLFKYIYSHDVVATNPSLNIYTTEVDNGNYANSYANMHDAADVETLIVDEAVGGDIDITDGDWHYLTVVRVRNGTNKFYVDGISQDTSTGNDTVMAFAGPIFIGVREDLDASRCFGGYLDEPRISNAERTVGWTLTEYNNQYSPSTFYTLGSGIGVPSGTSSTTTTTTTCTTTTTPPP